MCLILPGEGRAVDYPAGNERPANGVLFELRPGWHPCPMLLPATFPQVQRLECVRIDDPTGSHQWTEVPGTVTGTWLGDEAQEVLGLVADLPPGEIMRCFMPGYGIRAHGAGQLLFEVAFCFQCHNALILQPAPHERRDMVGFGADSQRAQDLLALFKAC